MLRFKAERQQREERSDRFGSDAFKMRTDFQFAGVKHVLDASAPDTSSREIGQCPSVSGGSAATDWLQRGWLESGSGGCYGCCYHGYGTISLRISFDSQYVSKVGRIVDRSLAYSSPRSPKMLKLS